MSGVQDLRAARHVLFAVRSRDEYHATFSEYLGSGTAFCVQRHGRADAAAIAAGALNGDIDHLIDTRKQWVEQIASPARLPVGLEAAYRKAVTIKRVNTSTPEGQIRHRWTTPDRFPHRWMWLHDSAYRATGHVHHFPDLAMDMLLAVFDTRDGDGRFALLMRPDGNFPEISQSPMRSAAAPSPSSTAGGSTPAASTNSTIAAR